MEENNMTKRRFSIRYKWSVFICTAILISLLSTVAFTYFTISGILKKDDRTQNETNASQAAEQINLELKGYKDSVEQLADLVSTDLSRKQSMANVEATIHTIQKNNKALVAAYYMDWNTGKLHISPYAKFDMDVRDTRTYKQLKANPETQWMDVYKDKVTGKIMTSIVTPVMYKGKMVGAVGYDIDLSTISQARKKFEKDTASHLAILDAQGVVVTSFINGADGKNIKPSNSGKVEGVKDIESSSKLRSQFKWVEDAYKKQSGEYTLTWAGTKYNLYSTTIPTVNWKVVSFNPQKEIQVQLNKVQMTGLYSIIIGLMIGLICAFFLASRLTKIITNLRKTLAKTAKGDLVTEFVIHSNDEFGDLSKSYNEMLHHMRNLIINVGKNIYSVNETTSNLKMSTSENETAISEVSKAIEEIAVGAENQSDRIDRGSSIIQELSTEIEKLFNQSNAIAAEVDEATGRTQLGTERVKDLQTSYHQLEEAFQHVTNMIEQLNEKSKSISDVTGVINQIAEQTNLLSLNASIEAARAGESGKGFAVVANEVRNLAERSKESTNHIQQIINNVLEDTAELVNVMKKTNDISHNQKEAVTSVSQAMKELKTSLDTMLHSIKEETVSIQSIEEQKQLVIKMIEDIAEVSQETAASTEEISSSMEEQAALSSELARHTVHLSQLTENLQNEIGEFKVTGITKNNRAE
ncbi:methyl-accepting chemotaxis protein [Heyndrickxia ginsengihumi]|uniref:methyl-accepting chemotaxis protein n=1 Tax=Heyndrickxia ginsengihumi TaxID=363870 RepID=UPI003D1C5D10